MDMTRANRRDRSLVLSHSQSNVQGNTDKYKYIIDKIPTILRPAVVYLLNMPFIGLVVDILRLTWRICAFIVSAFSGKLIRRQRKGEPAPVVDLKQEAQSLAAEPEQEKRLKEHFLVMASHELKTPMTTILGQVQLMLRRLSKMPELSSDLLFMRVALESIDRQTRRLNIIVNDLLDLYNIRAGEVQLRLIACNLVDLCREVVEEQRLFTGRSIKLELPSTPVILQADNDRLRQVMVNLVANAIKYSPADSPVKVLVDQRRDIAIIEVYDSGTGISKDEQTHIFEPFYRGSNVEATVKNGLGLGLAICKEIVERHAGRIWCRSRAGQGSIFIVELPISRKLNQKAR